MGVYKLSFYWGTAAIGVVARDCNGKSTAGANKLVRVKSAAVAEALALKEGARLAVERRYNKVIFGGMLK